MAQPYVGEIRIFAGNFAPAGWMLCEGQLLSMSENEVLFNLIGTTYGGDGQSTFALPDLRGRLPIHMGTGLSGTTYYLAQSTGTESVTLTVNQLPPHSHGAVSATSARGDSNNPQGNLFAQTPSLNNYATATAATGLHGNAVLTAGTGQAHTNLMPYLCVNFIISLFGIYPSPT